MRVAIVLDSFEVRQQARRAKEVTCEVLAEQPAGWYLRGFRLSRSWHSFGSRLGGQPISTSIPRCAASCSIRAGEPSGTSRPTWPRCAPRRGPWAGPGERASGTLRSPDHFGSTQRALLAKTNGAGHRTIAAVLGSPRHQPCAAGSAAPAAHMPSGCIILDAGLNP